MKPNKKIIWIALAVCFAAIALLIVFLGFSSYYGIDYMLPFIFGNLSIAAIILLGIGIYFLYVIAVNLYEIANKKKDDDKKD